MIKAMALVAISAFCLMQESLAGNVVPVDQEFVLKPGQEVIIENTKIRIIFDSVLEDHRCPVDVLCGWAGNAKVNLALKKGRKKQLSVIVNTVEEPREAEYRGYVVKLVKLTPERKAGEEIPASDYEVRLKVSRLNEVKSEGGLTSRCSGAREANFLWFLWCPFTAPLNAGVRRFIFSGEAT